MTRQNIKTIVQEMTTEYIKGGGHYHGNLAIDYWNVRTIEEVYRDENADVTILDYEFWILGTFFESSNN